MENGEQNVLRYCPASREKAPLPEGRGNCCRSFWNPAFLWGKIDCSINWKRMILLRALGLLHWTLSSSRPLGVSLGRGTEFYQWSIFGVGWGFIFLFSCTKTKIFHSDKCSKQSRFAWTSCPPAPNFNLLKCSHNQTLWPTMSIRHKNPSLIKSLGNQLLC